MSSTMTTIMTSTTLRIREETFQDAYEQMSRWPLTVGTLGQAYFRDNQERLMSLDLLCFQELHALLDVPEDPYAMYLGNPDSQNPDGYFYAKFYTLGYPILAEVEKTKEEEKKQTYRRILHEGNLVAWVELFNTAIDAQAARIRAGIEDSDEHRNVTIMHEVWTEWKRETQ